MNHLLTGLCLLLCLTQQVLAQKEDGQLFEDGNHIDAIIQWVLKFREMSSFSEIVRKFEKAHPEGGDFEESLKKVRCRQFRARTYVILKIWAKEICKQNRFRPPGY